MHRYGRKKLWLAYPKASGDAGQVYFQCKTDLWFEDTICENIDPNIGLKLLQNDNPLGGSPFIQYEIIVMNYTNRCFGFEDDILSAFRGLENPLCPSLMVEYLLEITSLNV